MRYDTEGAFEEIDACLFSGDEFYDKFLLQEVKDYIERWQRRIVEIEETLNELEAEQALL